jgi:5-methylcytosine-specific restriction endonuclease McrA
MPLVEVKNYPQPVIDGLKAALARNDDWTAVAAKAAKDALVEHLIKIQGSRCAYCKRLIKNEIGLRELDHILPQGALGKSVIRAASNAKDDRRVTTGYPAFRFEPANLILTCKRCNHRKGSYDCRKDRSAAAAAVYPATAADFEWVHPAYHEFDDHITLLNEFAYQEVPGSNGAAVIDACKLAGIEALEARARDLRLKEIKDVNMLVLELLREDLPDDDIVDSVMLHFPQVLEQKIRKAVRGFRDNKIA